MLAKLNARLMAATIGGKAAGIDPDFLMPMAEAIKDRQADQAWTARRLHSGLLAAQMAERLAYLSLGLILAAMSGPYLLQWVMRSLGLPPLGGNWGLLVAIGVAAFLPAIPWAINQIIRPLGELEADWAMQLMTRGWFRPPIQIEADVADLYRPAGQVEPVLSEVDLSPSILCRATWLTVLGGVSLVYSLFTTIVTPPRLLVLTSIGPGVLLVVWLFLMLPLPLKRRAQEAATGASLAGDTAIQATMPLNITENAWARRAEKAGTAQFRLGTTTGVAAQRGDPLGADAGLDMAFSLRDLMGHILCLGGSGSSKTSSVALPLIEQIGQITAGLLVLDGKATLPAEAARRIAEMEIIEPPMVMSLTEGLKPETFAATIAQIASAKGDDNAFFSSSAAALLDAAARVVHSTGKAEDWTALNIWRVASNEKMRQAFISDIPDDAADRIEVRAALEFWATWAETDEKTRGNIQATLQSWLAPLLSNPALLPWAEAHTGLKVEAVLEGKRMGLNLPEFRYGLAGALVSALAKARLYAAVQERGETWQVPTIIAMDEAQAILTSSDDAILPIGRSLGLGLVLLSQNMDGIEAQLGEERAKRLMAIPATVVAFGTRSPKTAAWLAERIGGFVRARPERSSPTVRASITAAVADARAGFDEAVSPRSLVRAAASWVLKSEEGDGGGEMWRVETGPLIDPVEFETLLAAPSLAAVVWNRGGIPRRDLVQL